MSTLCISVGNKQWLFRIALFYPLYTLRGYFSRLLAPMTTNQSHSPPSSGFVVFLSLYYLFNPMLIQYFHPTLKPTHDIFSDFLSKVVSLHLSLWLNQRKHRYKYLVCILYYPTNNRLIPGWHSTITHTNP